MTSSSNARSATASAIWCAAWYPRMKPTPLVKAFKAGEKAAVKRVAAIQAEYDPQGQAVRTFTAAMQANVLARISTSIREMERIFDACIADVVRRRVAYEGGVPRNRRVLSATCYGYPPPTRMRIPDNDEDAVL